MNWRRVMPESAVAGCFDIDGLLRAVPGAHKQILARELLVLCDAGGPGMRNNWQFGLQAGKLITMLAFKAATIKNLFRLRRMPGPEADSRDANCHLTLAQPQRR